MPFHWLWQRFACGFIDDWRQIQTSDSRCALFVWVCGRDCLEILGHGLGWASLSPGFANSGQWLARPWPVSHWAVGSSSGSPAKKNDFGLEISWRLIHISSCLRSIRTPVGAVEQNIDFISFDDSPPNPGLAWLANLHIWYWSCLSVKGAVDAKRVTTAQPISEIAQNVSPALPL